MNTYGKVFGDYSDNDPLTVSVSGNQIGSGNIDAQGNFSAAVAFSDLKDHLALTVNVTATDKAGNSGTLSSAETDYSINHNSFLIIMIMRKLLWLIE